MSRLQAVCPGSTYMSRRARCGVASSTTAATWCAMSKLRTAPKSPAPLYLHLTPSPTPTAPAPYPMPHAPCSAFTCQVRQSNTYFPDDARHDELKRR